MSNESPRVNENLVASEVTQETPVEAAGKQTDVRAEYVAVVYFHGMGSQRRLEETSRLVEALDDVSNNGKRALFDITCHVEPSSVMPGEVIQYIRTLHPGTRQNTMNGPLAPRSSRLVRFYEGYWAPITAQEVGAKAVLLWLVKQATRPYMMLLGTGSNQLKSLRPDTQKKQPVAPNPRPTGRFSWIQTLLPTWDWRGHARLRRAALRELDARHKALNLRAASKPPPQPPQAGQSTSQNKAVRIQPGDMRILLRAYHRFEGLEARRKYPTGSFAEFRDFLKAELERLRVDDPILTRIPLIADAWMRYILFAELRNAAVLTSIVLAIGLAVLGSLQLVSIFLGIAPVKGLLGGDWNAATIVTAFATLFGFAPFLSRYFGDVVFWSTYEETNVRFKQRKEILRYGANVLKHVLTDEKCLRVVVIAHSLGAAIAHDVLLELGKEDWARDHNDDRFKSCDVDLITKEEINKIEHLVTAGSPIDKIHYFFESDPGRSHRYTRVAETVRGDMGRKPFGNNNNTPYLHWINFWDKADIISGSLESPPNATDTEVCVDNFEVSNGTWNPGAAHTSYFVNRVVLQYLWGIIYENKYSYWAIGYPKREEIRSRPNYLALNIGPGSGSSIVRWVQVIVLTAPWIILWHFIHVLLGDSPRESAIGQ
ncbi:MAG: hypothetical protein JWP89_6466 [Schlesneria sp.]|nr:hypothetical protein [Schlesneria sp.]